MSLFEEHLTLAKEYFIIDYGREPSEEELLIYFRQIFRYYWT